MTSIDNRVKYTFNPKLLKCLKLDTKNKYSIYEIYLECKKPKNNVISTEMREFFPELNKETWIPPYYMMRYLIKNHIICNRLNIDYIILNNCKHIAIDHIKINL